MRRLRSMLARLTWAAWVVSAAGLVLTLGAEAVLASHLLAGVPATLDRLTWLAGPAWLVAVGLGLQAFVMFELVRIFGRWHLRLSRDRRERADG